jgi:hypothetical protein
MPSDWKDVRVPATAALIRELCERSLLKRAQSDALEKLLRSRLDWQMWISRLLLFLGTALLLAGVIFFFAFNWKNIPPAQKFAIIEAGIFISAVSAWWVGIDALIGKVLLSAACVLAGVFLAVFGQIYQTGADTYELFSGWVLLILPWVLLARFGALWIFWLALVNAGILLYWDQSLASWSDSASKFTDQTATLAILNAAALAAREWGWRRKVDWLSENWLRIILILAVFGFLTASMCVLIIDSHVASHRALSPRFSFRSRRDFGFTDSCFRASSASRSEP